VRLRIPDPVWRLILIIVAVLAVTGCLGQRPQVIAQRYVDALKERSYGECYVMMTEEDRQARTPDRFVSAIPLAPDVTSTWFKLILEATSYKVGESRRDGPRAIVPVIVTTPDLALFERTIEAYVGPDGDPVQAARDALKSGDYPKLTYEDDIVLMKEHHRWRVEVDFAARDAAATQRRAGLEAYYKYDFNQAVSAYDGALGILRKSDATGARGLEFLYGREQAEIMAIQSDTAAAKTYVPRLVLSDVGMKMSADHRPAVFGKITNNGNRAIDGIRMSIMFYSGSGAARHIIFSENRTPISTPLEFANFTLRAVPLAPGETRAFGVELGAPAEAEESGDPFVAVDGIIFTPAALMPAAATGPAGAGHEQEDE
jgi:hypothetical protein